jgi:hypothetical protein
MPVHATTVVTQTAIASARPETDLRRRSVNREYPVKFTIGPQSENLATGRTPSVRPSVEDRPARCQQTGTIRIVPVP